MFLEVILLFSEDEFHQKESCDFWRNSKYLPNIFEFITSASSWSLDFGGEAYKERFFF